MKRRSCCLLLFAIGMASAGTTCSPNVDEYKACQLSDVIDGDTIDVDCQRGAVRVRLLRIDTPERNEPGYEAATQALRQLLGDGDLELEFERPGLAVADDFQRLLAYVRVNGMNVNVEMVRLGWSEFWTKYGEGRFAAEFRTAEEQARFKRSGIWANPDLEVNPEESQLHRGSLSGCRPRSGCCRLCKEGKACGDSCLSRNRECRNRAGCACDAEEVCPRQ